MADFEQALYSQLQAITAVTDLVGTRCYPFDDLPQNAQLPAIGFIVEDEDRVMALSADCGLVMPWVHIYSYSATRLGALAVASAVRAGLKRQAWTQDGIAVLDAEFHSRGQGSESPAPDIKRYWAMHEVRFWHRE